MMVNHDVCDVVVVCALREELDAVLALPSEHGEMRSWSEFSIENDPTPYHSSTMISRDGEEIRLIAGCAIEMGSGAAAALTTKMILRFHPQLVAMAGVAAGARPDTQAFGDILVADKTFNYQDGKLDPEGAEITLKPDPQPRRASDAVIQLAKLWEEPGNGDLAGMHTSWQKKTRTHQQQRAPQVHIGPLASGNAVLNVERPIEELRKNWRKLVGIEMEAHGVHQAVAVARANPPLFLCAKSICDFAQGKSDDHKAYAAFTSAEFLFSFLRRGWAHLKRQRSEAANDISGPWVTARPVERKHVRYRELYFFDIVNTRVRGTITCWDSHLQPGGAWGDEEVRTYVIEGTYIDGLMAAQYRHSDGKGGVGAFVFQRVGQHLDGGCVYFSTAQSKSADVKLDKYRLIQGSEPPKTAAPVPTKKR